MPRPARRAAATADVDERAAVTPTRNPITAPIPDVMLATPDFRPPQTHGHQPTHNPNESIVPIGDEHTGTNARRSHNRATPGPADGDDHGPEGSQASTHALTAPSEAGEQSYLSSIQQEAEDARELVGLRDISSLATWTLSSAKPGCGLPQLRSPSVAQLWQSDGPQPHTLTLHFPKVCSILKLRLYLDFELDESYCPVDISFWAGMSEGALVQFGKWVCIEETDPETGETRSTVENVKGWINIDLEGVGGREKRYFEAAEDGDFEVPTVPGNVLKAMVVQMRVHANHQNGKDCHVRGFQVFSRDQSDGTIVPIRKKSAKAATKGAAGGTKEAVSVHLADWMGEPEIR